VSNDNQGGGTIIGGEDPLGIVQANVQRIPAKVSEIAAKYSQDETSITLTEGEFIVATLALIGRTFSQES
jgi:hypothetical protein